MTCLSIISNYIYSFAIVQF